MRLHPLFLPALLLVGACAPDRPDTPATPTWHAVEVAMIGADSGANAFTSVRSLLFTPAGELLVVDQRERQVKVFDSTGRFVRMLGRSGAGPGEYGDPYSLAWLGDTLALLDPRNSRVGLFDANGKWAGQLPVQPISGGSTVRLYRTPGPAFWALGYKVVDKAGVGLFVRYTTAGPQDTLPSYQPPPGRTTAITCEFPDKSLRFFSAPFAPTDLQLPTPTGLRAIARTDAYRIDFLGTAGDTVGTIARADAGEVIPDSAWEAGLEEWNEVKKTGPSIRCDADGFDRPATKPILAALFYDPQGRLWVEVHSPAGVRYDVYDATGAQVAAVTGLPSSGEVDPAFFGDRIAIALPTDDGFPRIGIYQAVTERHEQ